MDWPGRGRPYQSSQAWFFATPEEVYGKRDMEDKTEWRYDTTPSPYEAFSREFSSRMWDSDVSHRNPRAKGPTRGQDAAVSSVYASNQAQATATSKAPAKSIIKTAEKASQEARKAPDTSNIAACIIEKNKSTAGPRNKNKRKKNKAKANQTTDIAIVPEVKAKVSEKQPEAQKATDHTVVSEKKEKSKKQPRHRKAMNSKKVERVEPADLALVTGRIVEDKPTKAKGLTKDCSIMESPPLIKLVQQTVDQYRNQSATHFALHINVQFSESDRVPDRNTPDFKLELTFQNYSQQVQKICRQKFRNGRPTRVVQVRENGRWIPLHVLLGRHFPVSEANASEETLKAYWDGNGKSFNWAGLATELKENVIQFCIVKAPRHPDSFHEIGQTGRDPRLIVRSYGPPVCEVIDRLGEWKDLLLVSTQVRTITLRLCLSGSVAFDKGLCITSNRYSNFQSRLQDLDLHAQIIEPNSVPPKQNPEDIGHLLRDAYRDTPKLYPELQRYATFLHGIRKIDICFGFIDFYRFFKVTVGGFDRQPKRRNQTITCDVLDKLLFLNEIVVRLPERRQHWLNRTAEPERPLFHSVFPCLRNIFRILYERIAEALAAYENVSVKNFLDESEEDRFWGLRRTAVKALEGADLPQPDRLTVDQLLELNEHDGGGIQLPASDGDETFENKEAAEADGFYPIHCECAVSCREQYDYDPGEL
ncbi:hypothetical protein BU23DRAFT_553411 [Bimuria novae-zelandiae CBS 107.79]|uniref:Uncharacterized protein n=1 Tax=Bimuria novae-zelandiae CBS 107.79 TaxID=1447943 RepID=A0A6A5VDB6_9PLEO|nr:hypothetical protein BU23DRAFT_553411 [Bimuria novae-zelandiae CBS 107.79]